MIETEQKIIFGKNIPALQEMDENSVDSIVTDAPYGLGEEPDAVQVMKDWVEKGYHEVKGKGGFMGKSWDAFVPQPLFWKEAYRVLKPGGHVLCFFGTRTYDWGVMAMRFAGFEIRDLVEYIYGTGFPKSLAVDKAIDKHFGVKSRVVGQAKRSGKEAGTYGAFEGDNVLTEAVTEEAKRWAGYGTALKPSHEPIVLARKPLSEKTVASNVLKHGTGGINIDACRISTDEKLSIGSNKRANGAINFGMKDNKEAQEQNALGRFPANLILDEFTAAELDKQSGVSKSTGGNGSKFNSANRVAYSNKSLHNIVKDGEFGLGFGDEGGASRFFYIAKPDVRERERGLRHFEFKDPASVTDFRPTLKSNPENWANGTETPYTRTKQRKNIHPTVKPVSLMRYLVKMVTPKGGLCLDPYNGSGTTGMACKIEQINYIGIEQNEYDCEISKARIASVQPERKQQTLL